MPPRTTARHASTILERRRHRIAERACEHLRGTMAADHPTNRSFDSDTPVALILFQRPELLRRIVEVIRPDRPRRIFAIADGPRPDRPGDRERCLAARAVLDSIDWPCEIERDCSDRNLGADQRIQSGLDRLFGQVDRAIVLEDDLVPHRSFLAWADDALRRSADDPSLAFVTGFNAMGRWGDADADHLLARKGRTLGWGTTAEAWKRINESDLTTANAIASSRDLDPLLLEQCALVADQHRRGIPLAWDNVFRTKAMVTGRYCVVASVNLVAYAGFDTAADRTVDPEEFSLHMPSCAARPTAGDRQREPDAVYDRQATLVELMGLSLRPEIAARLAKALQENPALAIDPVDRLHLRPFLHAEDSLRAIGHLRNAGVSTSRMDRLEHVLREFRTAIGD